VAKVCKSASDSTAPGSVINCLRSNKQKLVAACRNEVFRTQTEAAEDYRFDANLYKACKSAVEKHCADGEGGEELDCLMENSKSLGWDCLEEVVRLQKQGGDDIRLNIKLFKYCLNDQKKFCKDVEPGHMRVQECLEDHMDDSGFSNACKKQLENVIAKRVADFRFDIAVQQACEEDLKTTCSTSIGEMEKDETGLKKTSGLNCLQQFKEELKSQECKDQIARRTSRAARDIRFDDVLANACQDDRKKYCNDVQPGSARVIRCLQEHRQNLGQRCAAALFDHEVKMAEDIDFKYPMRKACAWEISKFCKNIPHGHARVVRCLQQNIDNEDMSVECSSEVVKDQNRMAQDYRLNWRLSKACGGEIKELCTGLCNPQTMQPCGGVVLHCLQEKQANISSEACQEEVFYYQLMEVTDYRNDVILAEACRADVEKHCKDVEPGEGRVHHCLRIKRDIISDRCREEEMKLQAIEYKDIRLRPKLAKVCSEERSVYCKDVKPGRARVMQCLVENMAKPNFGEECRAELKKREEAVKSDYRYDVGVLTNCGPDIDKLCAEAKTKLRGTASVLKCLAEKFSDTQENCQNEMSRAVRFALWDYSEEAPLTAVCDADVKSICPKNAGKRRSGVFTIGVVGRCLSKALVQGQNLDPKCKQLVLVAAPKDSRVYLQYPESGSALVQMVAELQRKAGLESVLVDPYKKSGSAVTVTGWVALACMLSIVVVAIWGMVLLYRRVTGADKPHTQYLKSGDA